MKAVVSTPQAPASLAGLAFWWIVAAGLLLAHGCHGGDADHELFTRFFVLWP